MTGVAIMTEHNRPKPDDRSDNVEKLQEMVQDTLQNIEKAEHTMENADGPERQAIADKNERRREAVDGFRNEIKDEAADQKGYE